MWNRNYRKFLKSNWHSLERWGLAYLHSPHALDALACAIAQEFSHRRIKVVVSIESVWIDGTPQVKAETHSGKVQCELVWCLKSNHQIIELAARATDAKMVSALLCHTNGLGSSL